MRSQNLKDVPEVIETDRLLLRSPRPGDGVALNAAIRETIASLQQWMPWAHPPPDAEQSEAYCRTAFAGFEAREDFPHLLLLKDGGTVVGCSGVHPAGWDVPQFEIGYWCRTSFEGQGYISEAVRAITRFGFEALDARRLFIQCDSRNTRSLRVAERCGYKLEAELRGDRYGADGQLADTVVFARISKDE